jgi:hypothetical protein
MRLLVANSQPVDFLLPSGAMLAALLPGRLRIQTSVTASWQGLTSIFKGLLKLRPSRDPTCPLAPGWAIEFVVPKRGQLVPLWYLAQNMPHGKGARFLRSLIVPKRFRRPASIDPARNYFSSKITSFRFGTPDAAFPHSNCIQQRKGTPCHDRRSPRPYSLLSRYVRRTRETRNATCAA